MPTRDLTRRIESGMPTYPGDPDVSVEPHATFADDGYRVSALRLGSHAGTHVDAPSHTEADGATIDDLPVSRFDWRAVRLDLRGKDAREPIVRADLDDLSRPAGADLLVLDTGWAEEWGTPRALDHPFLDREAATWCADRGLDVATDAFGVDPTPGPNASDDEPDGVPAHHALLGAGRVIVENLTNLGGPPGSFRLRAYPLSIVGGDGAPARAVAEW